jgi:hypothetical protein
MQHTVAFFKTAQEFREEDRHPRTAVQSTSHRATTSPEASLPVKIEDEYDADFERY